MPLADDVAALLQRLPREGPVDDIAALEPRYIPAQDPALHWSDAAQPGDEATAYNAIYACLRLGRWDDTVARCHAAIATW